MVALQGTNSSGDFFSAILCALTLLFSSDTKGLLLTIAIMKSQSAMTLLISFTYICGHISSWVLCRETHSNRTNAQEQASLV